MSIFRRLSSCGALLGVVSLIACAGPKTPPSPLLEPYLKIQTALAADAMDRVSTEAASLAREAERLGPAGVRIHAASLKLQTVSDRKTIRTNFGELSEAVIEYGRSSKTAAGSDLHVVYCPMVEMSWVQHGTAIRNPYFGKHMLQCGEVRGEF